MHLDVPAVDARKLLPHGQIEVYPDASHAINGEYAEKVGRLNRQKWCFTWVFITNLRSLITPVAWRSINMSTNRS